MDEIVEILKNIEGAMLGTVKDPGGMSAKIHDLEKDVEYIKKKLNGKT